MTTTHRTSLALVLVPLLALSMGLVACDDNETPATPDATTTPDTTTTGDGTGTPDATPDVTGQPDAAVTTCNAILQEGCAEGENCTYAQGATQPTCAPGGDKLYGQECAGQGDCAEGTCINLNDTGNYCYKYCKTQLHCSGVTVGSGGKAFLGPCLELSDSPYQVCEIDVDYENCDLFAQDCADSTKGCYVNPGDPAPVCLPAGTSPVGGDCQGVTDCAPGNTCVNTKCYKLCTDASQCETTFAQCSNYAAGAGICEEQ